MTSPATIVGSANGRSMTISITLEPRNRSRTSTQATRAPMKAFTIATPTESPIVNRSAAAVDGWVIPDQKSPAPAPNALPTTAASGSSTSRLSQRTTTPSETPETPRMGSPARPGLRRPVRAPAPVAATSAVTGARSSWAVMSGGVLDLGHDAVVAEELVVDDLPAAEGGDCHQVRHLREGVARVVGARYGGHLDAREHRPETLAGEDLLAVGALGELQEVLRLLGCGLGHRGRVLDEDALLRNDVVEVGAARPRADRLVLVGDEDVAGAGPELLGRLGATVRAALDARVELLQVGLGVGLGPALGEDVRVGGEDVPLRRAGRLRAGRHDLDAGLGDQVVPALDAERVALADDDDDDRIRDEALGRAAVPALGHLVRHQL